MATAPGAVTVSRMLVARAHVDQDAARAHGFVGIARLEAAAPAAPREHFVDGHQPES